MNAINDYHIIGRSNINNDLILQVSPDFLQIYNDMMKMNIYKLDPINEMKWSNDNTVAKLSNPDEVNKRFSSL